MGHVYYYYYYYYYRYTKVNSQRKYMCSMYFGRFLSSINLRLSVIFFFNVEVDSHLTCAKRVILACIYCFVYDYFFFIIVFQNC